MVSRLLIQWKDVKTEIGKTNERWETATKRKHGKTGVGKSGRRRQEKKRMKKAEVKEDKRGQEEAEAPERIRERTGDR
jgi:hypothetical protein